MTVLLALAKIFMLVAVGILALTIAHVWKKKGQCCNDKCETKQLDK